MATEYRLRSYEFRREREAGWAELELLVKQAEKKGITSLDAAELQRLPTLYRSVLSSLSVARAISLDKNVIQYLEGLSARAYFVIYCRKRFLGKTLLHYFLVTFPASVRRIRWAVALSLGVMILGVLAGFVLTENDPSRFFSFVDEGLAGERTPDASYETLHASLYTADSMGSRLTGLATFLFTHNARIGLLCFAVGFVAGVPVLLVLFANGAMLGAMWAVYAAKGLSYDFFAWVMPHGVTELLAVVLCGAAGLSLGYGLVFPGRFRRLDNLALRGRNAGSLAVGAVLLFFIAALIEGFFRQLVQDVDTRTAVIVGTALMWLAYFMLVGRKRGQGEAGDVDEADHVFQSPRQPKAVP